MGIFNRDRERAMWNQRESEWNRRKAEWDQVQSDQNSEQTQRSLSPTAPGGYSLPAAPGGYPILPPPGAALQPIVPVVGKSKPMDYLPLSGRERTAQHRLGLPKQNTNNYIRQILGGYYGA